MQPEDAFDAVHLQAAREVDEFLDALLGLGRMEPLEARRHADNAYLFVEFLANTYPKMPEEATERDAWVFLFDYSITQGPFAGPATRLTPKSLALFFDFLSRRRRVHDLEWIRAACSMEALHLQRLEAYERLAARAQAKGARAEDLEAEVDEWFLQLERAMRARGLAPDASLAGGDEKWAPDMGPVEAAVFDAVCLVLARCARQTARRAGDLRALEKALLDAQVAFMTQVNRNLGRSPLEAIRLERAQMKAPR